MNTLKILQLNVWGGRIKDGLSRFIADGNYDVVCMQEAVWSENDIGFLELYVDSVDKIKKAGGFPYDFRSSHTGIKLFDGNQIEQGIAIISKVPFKEVSDKWVLGEYAVANTVENFSTAISEHGYKAQKVVLKNGLTLVNYHGYWQKNPIGNEITVECMRRVADMIRDEQGPVMMCGDLNVSAESPAMRELDFLEDLTAKNQVKTTLRNLRFVLDVACDHALIGGGVVCNKFEVIDGYASDHQALSVEVEF